MKTKEITGWVYLDEDKNFTTMNFHQRIPDNFSEMKNVTKARLIVDLPEKSVSITESEFDEIEKEMGLHHMDSDARLAVKMLREKLFGDSNE